MNEAEARAFLAEVFGAVFASDKGVAAIDRYFTEDYRQVVDGRTLDRRAFERHVALLRETVATVRFTFRDVVARGDRIAEIHAIDATKRDGTRLEAEVFAFHTLEAGRIARIEEVTRLVSGPPGDRDLGSRT